MMFCIDDEGLSFFIDLLMKIPFKTAWILPKLDGIVLVTFEEITKIRKDA